MDATTPGTLCARRCRRLTERDGLQVVDQWPLGIPADGPLGGDKDGVLFLKQQLLPIN